MHAMFSDDMIEIVESFVVETQDIFEELDQDLLVLEHRADDKELVNKIFRAVHTIKGTSSFLDFQQMTELTHHFEDVLNKLRRDQIQFQTSMLDVMLEAFDMMKDLLQQVVDRDIRDIDLGNIAAKLEAISNSSNSDEETAPESAETTVDLTSFTAPPVVSLDMADFDVLPEVELDMADFDETPAEDIDMEALASAEQPEYVPPAAADGMHPMFSDDMLEIVESFVVETTEVFETLDQELLELEHNSQDKDLVNRIFRAIHTVKGTSGFLAFEEMSDLAHHFEDVLNKLRRDQLAFEPWMLDIMFEAFDLMKALLQQVIDRDLQHVNLTDINQKLAAISNGEKVSQAPKSPAAVSGTPSEKTVAPKSEPENTTANTNNGSVVAASKRPEKAADTTIRVDVRRLDSLMNLVGELVLGRNRLSQIIGNGVLTEESSEFLQQLMETGAQIDFITTELQSAVMKTRMVQIGRVFNRFPRVVRDISREFGKEIELVIEGEETEMDKSIIEEISDPLIHLVRNAADHGVESPEEREAAGKSRRGRIRLSAGHEGNHIVIAIEDDGKGIDPEKIKAKAVEKGVLTPQEAAEMTDTESYNLIFAPGFSMAKKLTSVSGRGVGMDVVKTNITKLNGIITVESEVGKGSRFTLKLPLTLAIIQGLLVNVGDETFAVPLSSVLEVVRTSRSDLSYIQGREMIRLRDRILPLVHVDDLLHVPGSKNKTSDRFYTVVIGVANSFFGLVVDSLLGQKEIVIKTLGTFLKNTQGIAGSTILGDGRVIMILDVGEVAKLMKNKIGYEA